MSSCKNVALALFKMTEDVNNFGPYCHGTSSIYLDDIEKYGLVPPNLRSDKKGVRKVTTPNILCSGDECHRLDGYYVSNNYKTCMTYAYRAAEVVGGKPVVLTLKKLPLEFKRGNETFFTEPKEDEDADIDAYRDELRWHLGVSKSIKRKKKHKRLPKDVWKGADNSCVGGKSTWKKIYQKMAKSFKICGPEITSAILSGVSNALKSLFCIDNLKLYIPLSPELITKKEYVNDEETEKKVKGYFEMYKDWYY